MGRIAAARAREDSGREDNRIRPEDLAVHGWYRFVLSFPPHLVRDYLGRFKLEGTQTVLDPFCGTGTTLVECKKLGFNSLGIEANPMPLLASRVKVDWTPDPDQLLEHSREVSERARERLAEEGIGEFDDLPLFSRRKRPNGRLRNLPPASFKLLLRDSISPVPLHKVLVLLETLETNAREEFKEHELLAVAKAIVFGASNLHFGPEVGVAPPKEDAPVLDVWLANVAQMAQDLRTLKGSRGAVARVLHADARDPTSVVGEASIDAVITSPPYPNEKDYTRTTRLESVLLGLVHNKQELRNLKQSLVRSNTRNVYKHDRDDVFVLSNRRVQEIARKIERRRIELGKTSGWERMYARVTKLYFGGMARHLGELRTVLRPGAQLAYVVGDQASYLRVMIRTGKLLAEIAHSLGYEVMGIDLFRTRLATATRAQLREEVVLLRWPG